MSAIELEALNEEQDEYTKSTSKLRDLVKSTTGFDIIKEDGKTFKDLYDIIVGIGDAWDDLDDLTQAGLAEALAGKRNARGLYSIFSNMDDLEDAYETAQGAAGSAQREQEAYAQSVQYSIDRAKASLEELANDFLSSDLLKGLIDAGNTALRIVDSLVQKLGSVGSIIAALGGLSTIKGLLGADSVVGSLVKGVAEKYTGKNLGNSLLKNIGELFSSPDFGKALGGSGKNLLKSIFGKGGKEAVEGALEGGVEAAAKGATSKVVEGMLKGAAQEGLEEGAEKAVKTAASSLAKEAAEEVAEGAAKVAQTGAEMAGSAVVSAAGAKAAGSAAAASAATEGAIAGETFMSAFLGSMNLATGMLAIAGIGTAVGVAWYQGYRKEIERQKQEGTSQWEQDKKNIQEYMQSYQELHDKLDDKTLTESEQIGIKEQILSLQHQILESYGEEASNIDLVNGELKEQMGILEGIATKRASDNLMENRNGYEDAKKAMTSKVDRTIVDTDALLTSQSDKMKDLIGEINKIDGLNAGIIKDYNGFDQFKIDINYDDVSSAVEGLNQLQSLLDTTIKKSPHDKSFLQDVNSIKDWVFGQGDGIFDLKGVRDIFDSYSKNKSVYDAYLEQTFAEKGGFKIISAMEQAVSDYNKAVSSMDVEELDKQSKQVTQTISDVESFAKKNDFESWQYQDKIDMAKAKMDSEGANLLYAQNALEVATGKSEKLVDSSPFKDDIEDITDYISKLEELGMSTVDVEDTLDKLSRTNSIDGLSAGQKAILNLATTLGIASTEGKTLSDVLANLGIVKTGDQVAQAQEQAPYIDITATKSKYKAAMQSIDSINSALVNSFSGKGLTYNWDEESGEFINDMDNIVKSFPDLSVNTAALFKRTANGIKINTEELRKLESEQQKITKQGFYKEQEKALKKLNEAKLKAAEEGRDINTDTNVEQARKAVEQIQYMIAAYDGATSAYQNWLEVAQQGEEGDMYDNIRDTAIKRGDELMKEGLIGTEEFRAIAELMSGQDLTEATAKEVKEAYKGINETIEGSSHTVRSFFEEGRQGAKNFANTLVELGKATKSEDGVYSFSNINTEDLAKEMNTSVDIVESALHKLKDYGFNIQWFNPEQLAQIDLCNEKIQNLSSRIEEVNKNAEHPVAYSIDVENLNDIESIDSEIINLQHILSESQTLQLNSEQYKAYSALLDELINKRNVLAGYDPSQGITSSSIQAGDAAFEDAIARFQAAADKGVTINIEGDEELQRDAQILAKLPPELKTKYGFEADADAQEILEVLQGKVKPVDQKLEAPAGTVSTDNVVQTEQTTNATVNVEANTEEAEKSVEDFTEDVESEPVTKKVKTEYTSEEKSEMAKDTSTESIRQEMISIHSEYDSSGSDQAKQAISEIPNEKDVEINAEATGVDEASAEIDDAAQSRQANIEVSATGDTTGVSDQEVTVTENFVKGDQQEPDPKPADVNYELEGQEEPLPKTSHVYYNWAGQSDPHDATAQLHYEGILTTLPTIIQTVQLHYTGGAGLPVTEHFAGTAQVGRSALSSFHGAAHASGNWGTRRTEKALLAELGPEILVLKKCHFVQ